MRIFSYIDHNGAAGPSGDVAGVRERIRANLSGVGATIALASARGGVGKSMLAVNIAAVLAMKGRKVAIVDADLNSPSVAAMLGMKPQRRLPMIEGIEPAAGPHGLRVVSSDQLPGGEAPPISFVQDQIDGNNGGEPVAPAPTRPAELSYRDALSRILAQSQFGSLDLLIIDLATGIDRLHVLASMMALDGVLLLTHPSAQDTSAARNAMKIGRAIGVLIVGIVENMVGFNCDGCRAVRPLWPEGDLHGIAREAGVPIMARLAFEPRLADSTDRGVPFVREYAATPTGKVLADIANQVDAMIASRTRAADTLA
ncbi:MAG TPA: P-loop NTPase [Candidatus Binatus sp.]|uniref:P-loop NTPase n=1 Tax=Candidatus Binatus sp. TaxID=2811406 RepID=UPI002B488B87|nr:P-loop NTPase [Candidatus Binatus sp.]HKN12032.1 P-loop NTPase [Candidatus Binatus sp.]